MSSFTGQLPVSASAVACSCGTTADSETCKCQAAHECKCRGECTCTNCPTHKPTKKAGCTCQLDCECAPGNWTCANHPNKTTD
ncbi:hypothetical protein JCM24511_02677 [Saitozyma sp. JCM 24511]|nr:hypothetical protein JCM24511_02677 [Saitozyma sp. JCM 24511]